MKNLIIKLLILLLVIFSLILFITCNPEVSDSGDSGDGGSSNNGTKGVESYIVEPVLDGEVLIGGEALHIEWFDFPEMVQEAVIELWGTLPSGEVVALEQLAYITSFNPYGYLDYVIDNSFFIEFYSLYQPDSYKIVIKDINTAYYEEGNLFTITPVIINSPYVPEEDITWEVNTSQTIDFRFSYDAITQGVDRIKVKLLGRNEDSLQWEELQLIEQIESDNPLFVINGGIGEISLDWMIPSKLSDLTDGLDFTVDAYKVKVELYDVDDTTEDETLIVDGTSRGFIKIKYPVLSTIVSVENCNPLFTHGYKESMKFKVSSTVINGELMIRTDILVNDKIAELDIDQVDIKNHSILTNGKRIQVFDSDTNEIISDHTDTNNFMISDSHHLVNLYDIDSLALEYNSMDEADIIINSSEKLVVNMVNEGDTIELTYDKNLGTLEKVKSEQMLPLKGDNAAPILVKTEIIYIYNKFNNEYIYVESKTTKVEYEMSAEELIGDEMAESMRSIYNAEEVTTLNSESELPTDGQLIPAPHGDIVLSEAGIAIPVINLSRESTLNASLLSRTDSECPADSYFEFK